MVVAVAGVLLALATSAPADVKGKWDGTVKAERPDGTVAEDTVLLVLDQKDATITGTVGGGENDQHPITSGTIDGNKVTILATHTRNAREYRLELTLADDEMTGTVASGEMRGQLAVKRRKQ